MIYFKLDGLDQFQAKLDSIGYDLKRKGGRAALRKAAQVVRDDAIRRAKALDDPLTAEVIAKNISERWNGRLFKRSGDLGFRVGVLGGARDYSAYGEITTGRNASKNPGGDTFYWRFIEFGTERTRAKPFLRPALAENVDKATDTFVREYEKSIDRAIKRAKK